MNRTLLPDPAGGTRSLDGMKRPWWSADFPPLDTLGGALDPEAPRALWRLVNIAEMAGLLVSSSEAALLEAFRKAGHTRAPIATELQRFDCTVVDLYVLVTLFSAASRGVPMSVLPRETLADPQSLRLSLDHLDGIRAIVAQGGPTADEAQLKLTTSGRNFAVLLTYRVINAAVMK